jgi:capsular exopolysaccharide synthesis family protein
LQQQVASLETRVEDADRKVEDYRQRADLVFGDRAPLLSQEITQANTQLLAAAAARVEAEARLREMQGLLAARNIDSAIDVMASPLIQQLRAQEIAVIRKKAELTSVYGERHAVMIQVNAELNDLETKINAEIRKIVDSYKNKVAIAQAQEKVLAQRLEDLKARIGQASKSEVQLNALDREAQSNRTVLQGFLVRIKETRAQMDSSIQQPEAEVISRAIIPESPYLPKPLIFLGLLTVATLSGVGVAVGAEQVDRSLRSTEELDLGGKVRTLALVPRLPKGLRRAEPEAYVLDHPSSMFAESIRSIYTAIRLSKSFEGRNMILFTSSHAGEGKTTISLCLGRLRSMAGCYCVLVEADLHKPSVCSRLGVDHEAGLAEILKGETEIYDVMVKDPDSGLFIIPPGTGSFDPAEAFASDRMRKLLDRLSKSFDLVLLDAPPVLAVSDALVLCHLINTVVLVVQWGETGVNTVKLTVEKIAEAGGDLIGVVMSMVNPKKHALTNFKDSDYFNKKTMRYYKN